MSAAVHEQTDATQARNAVARAAARLAEADRTGVPCAPVRDLIGAADVTAAYAVQERLTAARVERGAQIVGRKIGLTSAAVQEQLGVDQPDFGVLFDDGEYASGDAVPNTAVLQPRAEAEIAFVLKDDLLNGPLDAAQVREAIDYAAAALEICGSRISEWDISFSDTVADNASSGAFVLGPTRKALTEFQPKDAVMSMTINDEVVSSGTGAACLGDPIEAVVWLARRARDFGQPLHAGQVVLSGALGPMVEVKAGDKVRAVVAPLGAVQFSLTEEQS